MNWNFIDQPAARQWVEALCLTLMHSLWQGLVAAILAGMILLTTRKSRPAFRYNLLAGLMLLFVAGTVLTFNLTLRGSQDTPAVTTSLAREWVNQAIFQHPASPAVAAADANWMALITGFFSAHAQMIVAVWFLVFALKSLQAASGLLYLHRITGSVSAPGMQWVVRFYELAGRMRVNQEIELRESAQIAVPMVIGFLKPVVLVPLGMLANLPAAQVEAILLHELAHIRRRDYLVNLVQIFCENVFFFNPAVLWISKLIREEREHCCDDLAIGVMQNKTSFVHALVSFQEYNQSRPTFEMAFSKKRNHLLDRIKRIINNNNKPLDAMEKLFVTFSLAAAIALSAATAPEKPAKARAVFKQPESRGAAVKTPQAPKIAAIQKPDTLLRKKRTDMAIHSANVRGAREGISTYNVTRNGRQYEIVKRNGKMVSLWVDDQEIAEGDYPKYQSEIDEIMEEIKVQHELAEKQREEAEEMRKLADVQRREAEKQREAANEIRKLAEVQRRDADKQREQAHVMRLEAEKHREQAARIRVEAAKQREHADEMRLQAEKHRQLAEEQRKQADGMRKEAEKEREAYVKKQEGVIEELIKGGIVKSRDDVSFKLADDELIVNGEKQPADLHQRLKSKYLGDDAGGKTEMYYNFNGRSGYSRSR